jgi:hypothetical protein
VDYLERAALPQPRIARLRSGLVFGALVLVKPHALFLIPAYAGYRIYSKILSHVSRSWLGLVGSVTLTLGALLLVRLGVGWIIALSDNPLDPSLHGDLAYRMPGYKIWRPRQSRPAGGGDDNDARKAGSN